MFAEIDLVRHGRGQRALNRIVAGRTALAKVYVKVYSQMQDGAVKFSRDGYTALRGRFD